MEELIPHQEIEINGVLYQVKRLHEVPELIYECCDLINKEWKRSLTARLHSLEGSSENFPMSLLLLKNDTSSKVVGHCRISKHFRSNTKVFIETVVIHPDLRGKGLGKFLMKEVEIICKMKGIKQIYLSTKDQEQFYKKLGYTECSPTSLYETNDFKTKKEVKPLLNAVTKNSTNVPPPPPPPLPLIIEQNNVSCKIFMTKNCF